jgi:hypothetical protein
MPSIDLDKLDLAYDFLAETPAGHSALKEFRQALDTLHGKIGVDLNWPEFLYVARSLVQQLKMDEAKPETDFLKSATGEHIDTLKSFIYQNKPGAVTRLGANLTSPALSRLVPGGFMVNAEK